MPQVEAAARSLRRLSCFATNGELPKIITGLKIHPAAERLFGSITIHVMNQGAISNL
jgi:hypothetical protein